MPQAKNNVLIREERRPLLVIRENLGKRIAHLRKERKLSKAKLAAIVGMHDNHLYCIEAGLKYPRIGMLARLAAGLGVSIEEMVEKR